ncbi:MAG: hypothetical protein SW833_25570, partial [Cyanobacteriota bacterium]|nr:hypothetical protein [Cyanobacteriota bacterium]
KEGFTDYLNLYKASLYSYLAYVFSAHFLRLWLNNFFSKPYLEVSQWVSVPGHPAADLLNYEKLLGLEEMGDSQVSIGKLKLRLDLRQLLDGYETVASRRRKQLLDGYYDEDEGYPGVSDRVYQDNRDRRSQTTHQYGQGDNFGGDRIQGNR